MKRTIALVLLVAGVGGCAAPAEVVQIGPDRYSVNVGALGIEGGEAEARNKALASASNYCSGIHRQVNVLTLSSKGPVEWGSAAGSASVVFQCIPKPS
jgi:hypothetical protein